MPASAPQQRENAFARWVKAKSATTKPMRGTGQVCLNGPAARRCQPGDIVIVIAYASMEIEEARSFKPTVVFPDTATNRIQG